MDKDTGIQLDDVMMRIRDIQARRAVAETEPSKHSQILASMADKQSIGRSQRKRVPSRLMSIEEMIDKGYTMQMESLNTREPIMWKIAPEFNMNQVHMVKDPEPNSEIKMDAFESDEIAVLHIMDEIRKRSTVSVNEHAFDYAMKLVEK